MDAHAHARARGRRLTIYRVVSSAGRYRTLTPDGYCRVRGRAPLGAFAQFVDARPAAADERPVAPLRFWLRIRFGLATAPCKPIGKLLVWYPFTHASSEDALMRYDDTWERGPSPERTPTPHEPETYPEPQLASLDPKFASSGPKFASGTT